MIVLASPIVAVGQTPIPAPTTSPAEADICPVAVVAIEALGGPNGRTDGDLFSVLLSSPEGPGHVSGSLWVNSSAGAFHVALHDRIALSNHLEGPVDAIAFHLPVKAKLYNAFIDQLDDPTPVPCPIFNAWTPAITHYMKADMFPMLRPTGAVPPVEAEPIADIDTACKAPTAHFPPTTIYAATPQWPISPPVISERQTILVKVTLGPDSEIQDSSVYRSTIPALNIAALEAARRSIYRTEIKACRPVAASYIYAVSYGVGYR